MRIFVLVGLVATTGAYQPLVGVRVSRMTDGAETDLGAALQGGEGKTLLVLGTYAADFNAIEYLQRLRHFLPLLKERGITSSKVVLNAQPAAITALAKMLDIPDEVELYSDPSGSAGRAFGVSTGWRPDDAEMSPYVKLLGMLVGLGAWATLPAVLGGYIGNPWGKEAGWIETALVQGQLAGRWPDTALDLDPEGRVTENKFKVLPGVGGWGRRPLELATLRLQNMMGVSLKHWDELKPDIDADGQVLTQLGGCVVVDGDGTELYQWKDPGICAVAPFDELLEAL